MQIIEKQKFLTFFRDILEVRGGFEKEWGYFLDESCRTKISEDITSFTDIYIPAVHRVYLNLEEWLMGLPVDQQQEEIKTLLDRIQHYLLLADKYVLAIRHEFYGPNSIEYWVENLPLNEGYPAVKLSLETILSKLKKYLPPSKETPEVHISGTPTPLPSINQVTNKFNGMPVKDVREHFSKLTTNRSKKGNTPHLTEKQFEEFISSAFLNSQNNPQQKIQINFSRGEKGFIRNLFYQFYETSKKDYESTDHVKDKYVRLLTDNFEGFSYKSVFDNFNKK